MKTAVTAIILCAGLLLSGTFPNGDALCIFFVSEGRHFRYSDGKITEVSAQTLPAPEKESGFSLKNGILRISGSVVSDDVCDAFTLGKTVYFLKETERHMPYKALFRGNPTAEVRRFFEENPYIFRLYELYSVSDTYCRRIAENICDISTLYDNGRGEAVFKALSPDKVWLWRSDTVFSASEKADFKYAYADAYLLRENTTPEKIARTNADYFEIGDGVYFLDNGSLYCGKILLIRGVSDFAVSDGGVFYLKDRKLFLGTREIADNVDLIY